MTYTHHNIHTQRRCAVVREATLEGHPVFYVQVENQPLRQVWSQSAFKEHHREIDTNREPAV